MSNPASAAMFNLGFAALSAMSLSLHAQDARREQACGRRKEQCH